MRVFSIFLLVVGQYASAQFMEFGLGLGMTQYSGDLEYGYKLNTAGPAASLHYRLNFSEIVSTRFALTVGNIRASDDTPVDVLGENRDFSFNSTIVEISSVFEYHFLDYKNHDLAQKWSPYIFLGFGILRPGEVNGPSTDYSKNQAVIPMGIGFKHKVGKRFVLEWEAGARKTFFDELDGVSDNDVTVKNYQYGHPNDTDWYFFTGIRLSCVLYNIPCPFPYVPNRSMLRR